jgi:hypothetical protein
MKYPLEEEQRHVDPETGEETWVWRRVPADVERCRAWLRAGPYKDNQCTHRHIPGGVVCHVHGGNLPTVKKAAQRRLALAAFPAAEQLIFIALKKKGVSDGDRIKACVEILNRTGVVGTQVLEIEMKPWQTMLQTLAGEVSGAKAEDAAQEEGVDYEIIEGTFEEHDPDDF